MKRCRARLFTLVAPSARKRHRTKYWHVRFRIGKKVKQRTSYCHTSSGARDFAHLWLRQNEPALYHLHFD